MFLLLLLFTSLFLLSDQYGSTVSEYPITCSFTRHDDKYPRVEPFYSTSTSTQDECEAACEGDPHCGMYSWFAGPNPCIRYQMSEKMWVELGLDLDDLWYSDSYRVTGSKLCKGETLPTNYKYTEGKTPSHPAGFITEVRAPSLTRAYCKDLCTLYSECKSVVYYKETNGLHLNMCIVYRTTLSDGMWQCGSDPIILECGTYERETCKPQ